MRYVSSVSLLACTSALLLCFHVQAQGPETKPSPNNLLRIDATAPAAVPQPVTAALGSSRNPEGHVLGVNSQYLTMDGKPWLPVMGEFHFSRYPEAQWEQEILKMKAAGVQIIATYIIWIHHEETEGVFDWSGQRDLHRFVELCGKHGMYVYPRIGPWAHAEVRNGGFPDWVMKASPVRQNDPIYLSEVKTFYAEIAKQLKGELWKDGGPVIGIQIENEYRGGSEGKGDDHIRTLKAMAIADGLDVPLYTVTGWDGAAIPLDAVLPVFGGYPDAPWDGSSKMLPGNEVYAFRFDNRSAGSMGAIGGRGQNASSSYRGTPFLTAEVGDGTEDTYFRRPVISADDAASIAPIMLGSGANMLGYYMFHGGRNPDGGSIPLQESQRSGSATDVPEKSYDFQAPLGEYGQEEPSLRKLKLVHYFLQDFGASLAPMTARSPGRVPAGPFDTSVVRVSARTSGEQGFVFVSNYVRGLTMPSRHGFQIELSLPAGKVMVPESPIDLPAGSYGIWPVNLPLGAATLRYSTAQPFKRVESRGKSYFFFFSLPGVVPEFLLSADAAVRTTTAGVQQAHTPAGLRLRIFVPKTGVEATKTGVEATKTGVEATNADVELMDGTHIILLPEEQAEDVWKVDDPSVLLQTKAYAFSDGNTWTLQSTGRPTIDVGVFGNREQPRSESVPLRSLPEDGVFRIYQAALQPVVLTPQVAAVSVAGPRAPWKLGPPVSWRSNRIPLAPDDSDFSKAAAWRLTVPSLPRGLSDAFLKIHYEGDAARLYEAIPGQRRTLLDDNFWNGIPWTIGLREFEELPGKPLELEILPLPKRFPMYIEQSRDLHFVTDSVDELIGVEIVPQYQLVVQEVVR